MLAIKCGTRSVITLSYLCSFLSRFLMYVTLFSTLKSYFSGTEAPVYAATLSWSLASWSAETREVNLYTSELRTSQNKQRRQQNSSERPLNILRLKLQSHSAFLYNKKEIYPFIQSTFVALRAKLEKMVLHRCWKEY